MTEHLMTNARSVDDVADELGVTSAQVATAWTMAQRAETSDLPDDPDRVFIDELCQDIITEYVFRRP